MGSTALRKLFLTIRTNLWQWKNYFQPPENEKGDAKTNFWHAENEKGEAENDFQPPENRKGEA